MDPTTVWMILGTVIAAIIIGVPAWLFKQNHRKVEFAHDEIRRVENLLNSFRVEVAKNYPDKDEIRSMFTELKSQLARIENLLDNKQDKE